VEFQRKWFTLGPTIHLTAAAHLLNVTNSSELAISPFTLKPASSCAITVKAKYTSVSSWLPYSADITMSSDSIAVSAGSSRTVGRLQPITINAITFDDSYLPPLNPSQFLMLMVLRI
jgi:hypothetical protein